MSKNLVLIFSILGLVLLVMPAHTYAACVTISTGQTICDPPDANSSAVQITPTGTSGASIPPSASSGGITDCNISGAYSVSAGVMAALGGTFVPVNDAAVTLTTGYLVYKQCVLDKMAARLRDNAIANIVRTGATTFNTGRNGNPMYVVNLPAEQQARAQVVMDSLLNSNSPLASLSPEVKTALARDFARQQNPGNDFLSCSYTGTPEQLRAIQRGQGTGGTADLIVLTDPNCSALGQYLNAQAYADAVITGDRDTTKTYLDWSQGVYPVQDQNGNVITPGFLVAGTVQQQLGAGFNLQQNANDMNHIINGMFAGIGNILISQVNGGLQSLVQSISGQPSILSQVVQTTAQDAGNSVANAGLQILLAARQVELLFLNAKQSTGTVLVNAMQQLRRTENQCWDSLIPRVRTYAATGDCSVDAAGNPFACSGPFSIRVATSTVFSQAVIDANIAMLASSTANEITTSTATFNNINQLIAQVSAAGSPDIQQTALRQLNALDAQGSLHNQYDGQAAQQQAQDVQTSIGRLVADTVKHWGEDPLSGTDPSSGWCNINSTEVIRTWAHRWKI